MRRRFRAPGVSFGFYVAPSNDAEHGVRGRGLHALVLRANRNSGHALTSCCRNNPPVSAKTCPEEGRVDTGSFGIPGRPDTHARLQRAHTRHARTRESPVGLLRK
eukprot:GHVT01019688.1.p1 GENE.GHVT01019688.1~~GHVT01019688.1.p1  ORF type:complete len:105 (-),score=8.12 GHVT01019688.1:230-544(-)